MQIQFNPYAEWLEIPPEEQPPHYYRLLGVPIFEPDSEVIAAAFRQRFEIVKSKAVGKFQEESQQLLNELAAAKVSLMDPVRKAAYDASLQTTPVPSPVTPCVNELPSREAPRDPWKTVVRECRKSPHLAVIGGSLISLGLIACLLSRGMTVAPPKQPSPKPNSKAIVKSSKPSTVDSSTPNSIPSSTIKPELPSLESLPTFEWPHDPLVSPPSNPAPSKPPPSQASIVNGDFEDGLNGWKLEGGATGFATFGQPGTKCFHTYGKKRESTTGRMYQEFSIPVNASRIKFAVHGGGRHGLHIALLQQGKVIHKVTGRYSNTGFLVSWDITSLRGQYVVLEVVDNCNGGAWGFIGLDDVRIDSN